MFLDYEGKREDNLMYHPRLKGTHYEAGKHYASILYKNGFRFPEVAEEKLGYGKDCLPYLMKYCPLIAEEIKGFAEGCHSSFEEISSFLLSIGVLEEAGQCSIFASFNGSEVIIGRNYDMLFEFKKFTESSLVNLTEANLYVGHSDCFIGKVDGMNEHGLFVGITATPFHEVKPGLNFYFAVRWILENCKDVREAIQFLETFPSSTGNNYLIADKSGKMVVVEKSPEHWHVRYPKSHFIHCTNHFASQTISAEWNWSKSIERYDTLEERLMETKEQMNFKVAQSIMSETKGHVCLNLKKQRFGTLFSVLYNVNTLEIQRAEGQPNRASYISDNRLLDASKKVEYTK